MEFISDFHLHSKFSRATSSQMDLENMDKWAKIKGVKVLSVGDFTHPEWFKNLKEKLMPAEPGLYVLKSSREDSFQSSMREKTRFIFTTEISCIFSKKGKVRKVHLLIFAPSIEVAEKINIRLGWIGNLRADGRPILGLEAKELAKLLLDISEDCLILGAHVMTPWFGMFGSKSGFDSIEECFEEYSKYIYALESGLSADPKMLWRIPEGRKLTIISNSDAHSPTHIGREANVFDTELSYPAIIQAIKEKDPQKFLYTIEFYPEEGKYHYDGHRNCNLRLSPKETKKYNGICPRCGQPLTIGVLNRVEQLADKEEGFKPEGAIPYKSLVPLEEIIAEALGMTEGAKQVKKEYQHLIEEFGNEFNVLLNVSPSELGSVTLPEVVEGIIRVREGRVKVEPGYDGVYGKIRIFSQGEQKTIVGQKTLF